MTEIPVDHDREVLSIQRPLTTATAAADLNRSRIAKEGDFLVAVALTYEKRRAPEEGVVVTGYHDQPSGVLEHDHSGGSFQHVTLRPAVTVTTADMVEVAAGLHAEAHRRCFLARSMSFPVLHDATIHYR